MKLKNQIICIARKYQIKMSDGTEIEIDSNKPFDEYETEELLKKDKELQYFLNNFNITGIRNIKSSSNEDKNEEKENKIDDSKKENTKIDKDKINENYLNPEQRLNILLKTKDEFTIRDYQKLIQENGYKISYITARSDIEKALNRRKIKFLNKEGKKAVKYKVLENKSEMDAINIKKEVDNITL